MSRHATRHELAVVLLALIVGLGFLLPSTAFAQQPDAPPPDPGTWVGTAGAGLALTSGNSDTLNFNLAFDATRDPKTRNVMKWTGLFNGGLGVVWEKNPDRDVRTSMALTAGERLEHQLTPTSTIKHAATGLWKANDLSDGLYTFSAGLGTKISERLQLSVDLLDTFKNRPPTSATKKNDVALVTAITAKF